MVAGWQLRTELNDVVLTVLVDVHSASPASQHRRCKNDEAKAPGGTSLSKLNRTHIVPLMWLLSCGGRHCLTGSVPVRDQDSVSGLQIKSTNIA